MHPPVLMGLRWVCKMKLPAGEIRFVTAGRGFGPEQIERKGTNQTNRAVRGWREGEGVGVRPRELGNTGAVLEGAQQDLALLLWKETRSCGVICCPL